MNVVSYLNGSTHRSTDKQSYSGNETRGQLNFTARFVLVQSPGILARGMLGMIRFDESSSIKAIQRSTVVIAGEKDPVTLPAASQVLTDSIPTARGVTIPMGKHQAQMEMNESFLGALKGFIKDSLSADTAFAVKSERPFVTPPKPRPRLA
jgi:pimeloyl-ACP methyl ester carboxylesterase